MVAAICVAAQRVAGFAVPFSAGTPDFAVAVVSNEVSVVCTATVAVTCQAVRIQSLNQTTLGLAKSISIHRDYLDVEVVALDNSTLAVCFATQSTGSKCVQIRVDVNFGLMGDPFNEVDLCVNDGADQTEVCDRLAIVAGEDEQTLTACYTLNGNQGACSRVAFSGTPRSERLLVLDEAWSIAGPSLTKIADNGPLVLCTITIDLAEQERGSCRVLDSRTLQPLPDKKALDLGPASIVSAAYVGRTNGNRERLTICSLSTTTKRLICAAAFLLDGSLFISSRSAFAAQYEGLMGLKVVALSEDPSNLAAMGCLATLEDGPKELICSVIATKPTGVIAVDQNEMVVDENGFYLQNVPQALASIADVGAYVEPAQQFAAKLASVENIATSAPTSSSAASYIADVTVLPDFLRVFPSARGGLSVASAVSSMGCVNLGMHDMDQTRFCIGTASRLERPPVPRPPFPPADYCAVTKPWECEARKEHCAMVGSVCTSKYACSTQITPTGCSSLISQGGQCKFENGACVPTYEWDPKSMCQTVSRSSLCSGSPGCAWVDRACRATPYCQLSTRTLCRSSPGCVWISNQCGVRSTAL